MIAKRQRGATMWSILYVVGTLAFFLFLFFKLFIPYLDDLKVKSAMDAVAKEPGVAAWGKRDIAEKLAKHFDVSSAGNINPELVEITQKGKAKTITFNYEVVVPLAYNVSALLEFKHERQVRAE